MTWHDAVFHASIMDFPQSRNENINDSSHYYYKIYSYQSIRFLKKILLSNSYKTNIFEINDLHISLSLSVSLRPWTNATYRDITYVF